MTQITKEATTRKPRITLTMQQKLDYAKLMAYENYTNKQVMQIPGACSTAVSRWKQQYLLELSGNTPTTGNAMTPEQQEIQSLKKQLWRAKRDNEILKKASALFAMENLAVL